MNKQACCTPTQEELTLLRNGDYCAEELWGSDKPTCPKCIDKPALATGLTAQQVRWALSHDWYRSSERSDDGQGTPLYRVWVRGDVGEPERLDFTDIKALRAWAGY